MPESEQTVTVARECFKKERLSIIHSSNFAVICYTLEGSKFPRAGLQLPVNTLHRRDTTGKLNREQYISQAMPFLSSFHNINKFNSKHITAGFDPALHLGISLINMDILISDLVMPLFNRSRQKGVIDLKLGRRIGFDRV